MSRSGTADFGRIREAVRSWRGARILVVGDMMLDEYLFGRTDRVSREAPVVIVRYEGRSVAPGGAANAAMNVAALGGRASVFGLTGRDEQGRILRATLEGARVDCRGLIAAEGRDTTSKTRVLAGDYHAQLQQIVRIDREDRWDIPESVRRSLVHRIRREIGRCRAVILSDYGRGVLCESTIPVVIEGARDTGIPVVADSRFRLGSFRGVTTATPNEVEAAAAAGICPDEDGALERTGRTLLRRLGSDSVMITRGRFGMALFRRRRATETVGVVGSSEATDVTGAGDTVVAAVALSLAAGADMTTAMHAANIAASIVVMKRGTAVAAPGEVLSRLDAIEAGKVSIAP
ncbi:MAG: PfkB family carbohydrate kinase [Candidatus Krumholzibacteria bacterium]|nr:PfkB family carbohydrate kinase [Candidatus Krumholzibacteria bacterium]